MHSLKGVEKPESLDRLGTIEAALKRKQTALRVLKHRIDTKRGSRPIPAEDAARIAILQREVASLERSRNGELLGLASPEARQQRLKKHDREANWACGGLANDDPTAPPAPPEASGASLAAEMRRRGGESRVSLTGSVAGPPVPSAPALTAPRTPQTQDRHPPWRAPSINPTSPLPPPPPSDNGPASLIGVDSRPPHWQQHEREAAANEAWVAYKDAQRLRDEELRVSMRASWSMHSDELEALKQHAAPKVETRLSARAAESASALAAERERRRQSSEGADGRRSRKLHQMVHTTPSRTTTSFRTSPAISTAGSVAVGATASGDDGETPHASPAEAGAAVPPNALRHTAADAVVLEEAEAEKVALHDVLQRRRDQRVAGQEVRQMREREWARRSAELKRMKQATTKRVDDTHSAALLKAIEARPFTMTRSVSDSQPATPRGGNRSAPGHARAKARQGDARDTNEARDASRAAMVTAPAVSSRLGEPWPGYTSGLPCDPEAMARLHAYDLSLSRSVTAAPCAVGAVGGSSSPNEAGGPGGLGGGYQYHADPHRDEYGDFSAREVWRRYDSGGGGGGGEIGQWGSSFGSNIQGGASSSGGGALGEWRATSHSIVEHAIPAHSALVLSDEDLLYPGTYAASSGGWVGQPPRACTPSPSPSPSASLAATQRGCALPMPHAKHSALSRPYATYNTFSDSASPSRRTPRVPVWK